MTALYVIGIIVWLAVLGYATPATLHMMSGKPVHRGDPMRLACLVTALIFILGSLRWLIAPDNMTALAGIFVLLIADGIFILRLMRAYGRGPRV